MKPREFVPLADTALSDLLPPGERGSVWIRLLWLAGAMVCFVLGIVGWLIPVVTGIPFYVAGFLMLAACSERARRWLNRVEKDLPLSWRLKLRAAMERRRQKKLKSRSGRDKAVRYTARGH